MNQLILVALASLFGLAVGYFVRQAIAIRNRDSLESKLKEDSLKLKNQAQEVILEAKNKAVELLDEARKEEKERKAAISKIEERLIDKEKNLEEKEAKVEKVQEELSKEKEEIARFEEEVGELREKITNELSKVSDLSKEEAKERLIEQIKEQHKEDLSQTLHKLANERKEEIEKQGLEIITNAIQRYARENISDLTTSTFTLPSEDLKGKIIGREGRNIKTIERLTGAELIIDETPDTILISSFDPLRREIAIMTLQKLIKDGRIQPAKIEEKVEEAREEMEKRMYEIGEEAAYEVGIFDLPKEIVHLLGRLNFRTSYGQNVLTHSVEMAHIAGMIATELGLNPEVAKKGALLHDIGKAIDHEVEGTHVDIGRKILKKYGVSDSVVQAMESHHDDYPHATPEAFVVTTADIISAARPGARGGTVENYIKRLEDLERIAGEFDGVRQVYAISAGRELRVFVVPEKIDDFGALQLARDIAGKIQSEMNYPGEIKVNVIRETRATEYAK